ncbi:hypothetical protein [Rhizobium leguminosarum]|uniref:hypothetical protein n=1 Tax=Rhizobium leguminosarum TaxID=384 RepID=UPI0014419588|nr:hypothetical protein [Rhizobium leguminosarum]MBY5867707.1 hypothetical protein [Rhizobium leguminosarum]NKM04798.1 hypothetical protein [Rhizobium leguminosarum bv. viciae]
MRLVMFGLAGAGKEKQAGWMPRRLAIPHLNGRSTERIVTREPGVATTKAQIQKGALTSDEVDPALLVERLDQEVVSAVKAAVDKAGLLQRTRF